MTDVVEAVSSAEVTLQAVTAVRDKVVGALPGNPAHADLILGVMRGLDPRIRLGDCRVEPGNEFTTGKNNCHG